MLFFIFKNLHYTFRKSVINQVYNKLKFIIKYKKISKIKINIYKFFIFFLFGEIVLKKNNSLVVKEREHYNKSYTLHDDWFSHHIPIWNFSFDKYFNKSSKFKFLEIGVYEGRSILYVCENYKNAEIVSVDPFKNYGELNDYLGKSLDMNQVFKNFKKNISKFKKRIKHFKCTSLKFFKINKNLFDVIYIDGSHYHLDVMHDFEKSLKILKKNGIIILDDFSWSLYEKIEQNPIGGIFPVLCKNKNLKILSASYQLILQKI